MDNDQQPPPAPPEAPDAEKMNQIRRRRLEMLSGSSTPKITKPLEESAGISSSSAAPVSTENTEPTAKPKLNITKVPTPPTAVASKASDGPSDGGVAPTVRSTLEEGYLKRQRAKSDGQASPRPNPSKKQAPALPAESLESYEHTTLGSIFRITLDPTRTFDSSNHKLIYLPNLRQELEDEHAPIMFTKERLDSAILEAASAIPHSKGALDYLIPCWKRVMKAIKGLRGYASAKDVILKEAKRLCMSNCVFAVEMPEFFGREPNSALDTLTPYLLLEPTEDKGISPDFLAEMEARIEEDESIKPMLRKAVVGLSQQLAKMTMNDNYKPYVHALKALCQSSKFVAAIAEDPLFQMATSAPRIEMDTILGPFFRISPLQADVTKEYFASPKTMDKGKVRMSQEALRLTLTAHQEDLLDITNLFVKTGPISRNRILDWFAYIVNSNHKRRALRPNPAELSSDGFLLNVTVALDGLCVPFLDATFSKVGKIDVEYLRRNPRVDIKDETKLNADESSSTEYYKTVAPGTSNFISEVFFLTLAAHHYGSEATNSMLKSLDREIKYLTDKVKELEAERPKFLSSPINMARFEEQLRRVNAALDKSMAFKFAVEGVLFDKQMQAKSLSFMRVVTVWLLRVATQSEYTPDKTIKLPLPAEQPDAFKCLPEYVLEDIVGNFNFIFRFIPDVMLSAVGDEIIALCITFLTNSEYIKNPYLKAKLVSLLFHGTWPVYHRTKGVLGDSLIGTKFANDHLLHALMKFYIEVESTGAHTQFYDKFNIRYEIFQVIKCIWTNTVYQERLTQESKTNTEFFLRFVNLLLNDATYVLDEALTKFPKIHDLQAELRPPNTLTAEQRTTKEEELATAENQAQSYMQLTNETVSMMKLFTKTLSASFTMPEIVERVAAMVDYTLDTLVGPKSLNLKVDDPKKYQFEPKTLLSEFVEIYLNLGVSENFVEAVAGDGRSYIPTNFERATRILTKYNLRSAEDVAAWEKLIDRFKLAKELEDQNEEDLGEIPDDYLDPIMATLMKDPVVLPISRQVVDRSTIRSHLLSDPHDPFNRSPLKIEDVIDATELKAEIVAWRASMMQKAKQARGDDAMDMAEG